MKNDSWFQTSTVFLNVILHTYTPIKMEQTGCSETLVYNIQTSGNYPEKSTKYEERLWKFYVLHYKMGYTNFSFLLPPITFRRSTCLSKHRPTTKSHNCTAHELLGTEWSCLITTALLLLSFVSSMWSDEIRERNLIFCDVMFCNGQHNVARLFEETWRLRIQRLKVGWS